MGHLLAHFSLQKYNYKIYHAIYSYIYAKSSSPEVIGCKPLQVNAIRSHLFEINAQLTEKWLKEEA